MRQALRVFRAATCAVGGQFHVAQDIMRRPNQMDVRVKVELTVPAGEEHLREMRSAAATLTDDPQSVRASVVPDEPQAMLAEFTIPKARQRDVVDRIGYQFTLFMKDYSTQTIWFPKPVRKTEGNGSPPTKRSVSR